MDTVTLPALKAGYRVRPCTLDDVEAIVALMNACAIKVIGVADETVEQVRADWQRPDFDQAASQQVVLAADGSIVGWAEVHDAEVVVIFTDVYVHPDYEQEGTGEYLMAWVEIRAAQTIDAAPADARVALRAYCYGLGKDAWYSALLEASGFQPIRHSWHMDMRLDVPPPKPQQLEGVTIKVYDGQSDKRPIFNVKSTAFQDHFGHVERPFEEEYAEWLHRWVGESTFIPELWFLAMAGDTIAGVCLCKASHNGEDDRGWVGSLAVLREYRRRGIGEALLYTAFDAFYNMGKKRVGLGVDAGSLTGAATLYKRVGMHVAKQFDLYEKELRSGVDLTTHG
ncbi:MAG: GNAT family N-acetyltransferase [Anaerolineae bacterium]|nr:GNAT family N-acetyltransferase [Anaerolineae bacterium]